MEKILSIVIPILGLALAIIDIALLIINKKREDTIKQLTLSLDREKCIKESQKDEPIFIDYLSRGEGKSIRICYLGEILKATIIVHTLKQRDFIKVQAKTLGIDIVGVYAMSELRNHPEHMNIVVDDWEKFTENEKTLLKSRYTIKAVAFDSKEQV